MSAQFSASEVMAIEFMLQLMDRRLYFHESHELTPPVWCNFSFFSGIKTSPILKKERVEAGGSPYRRGFWKVERQVEFYVRRELVATVTLVGEKWDGYAKLTRQNPDNASSWAVRQIRYAQRFDREKPEHWQQVDLVVTSLVSRQV